MRRGRLFAAVLLLLGLCACGKPSEGGWSSMEKTGSMELQYAREYQVDYYTGGYALIGIEYTLIYNASGVLNFSHDKMVSLGAYIYAGMFVLGLGWNSVVSAIASLLLMAVFGILVAYLIFIPLRKQKSMIFTIMATIMFGKVIMEGACLIWGGNAFTIPDFMSGTYQIGNAVISKSNLFLIIAAIVIVALLQFYLQKTKPGKAMRCVAQNRTAASIVGIDAIWRSPSPSVP